MLLFASSAFAVAPPDADLTAEIHVAAAGDIACDPANGNFRDGAGTPHACQQRATAELLDGQPLAAVLALGDLQYEDGTLAKFMASYHPTWGRHRAITRPAIGNHEYGVRGAAGYFNYFGAAAGRPGEGYYSFTLGHWLFLSLNSNCALVGGCGPDSPQGRWLQSELDRHRGRSGCLGAFWHHPRFSSAVHGNQDQVAPLWRAVSAAGADLVLTGHDHTYERFAPQDSDGRYDPRHGTRHFVVGTGGRSHYPFRTARENSEVRSTGTFGVLFLKLGLAGYTWRFAPAAGGRFTDSGRAACR
ncbi:MAG: alkaline phosphatase [Armatimonadetes bacterium]|nr:alkaline phosphatase [Armatimonadota bacterium]